MLKWHKKGLQELKGKVMILEWECHCFRKRFPAEAGGSKQKRGPGKVVARLMGRMGGVKGFRRCS